MLEEQIFYFFYKMYRELRALVPRTRSDQSRRVYFSEHFKREYRLVRGELSGFLIIN